MGRDGILLIVILLMIGSMPLLVPWSRRSNYHHMLLGTMLLFLAACSETATLPFSAGTGPAPVLPAPQ